MLSGHETKKSLQQWEDEDEEYVPTEPYQRSMVSNIISLTQGYFYASFVNQSSNFTICDGNYTQVKVSFDFFTDQFGNASVTNISNGLEAISQVMATTYPLTYSCFYGGYEAQQTFTGYISTMSEPRALMYNLFASMGPMYDTVYYLLDW